MYNTGLASRGASGGVAPLDDTPRPLIEDEFILLKKYIFYVQNNI